MFHMEKRSRNMLIIIIIIIIIIININFWWWIESALKTSSSFPELTHRAKDHV